MGIASIYKCRRILTTLDDVAGPVIFGNLSSPPPRIVNPRRAFNSSRHARVCGVARGGRRARFAERARTKWKPRRRRRGNPSGASPARVMCV